LAAQAPVVEHIHLNGLFLVAAILLVAALFVGVLIDRYRSRGASPVSPPRRDR
jgi:hypothetical protein